MKKLIIVFFTLVLVLLSSCRESDDTESITVDKIRDISSLYETNVDNSWIVRRHNIEELKSYLGQPEKEITSDDGAISEYYYGFSDFKGYSIRFTYFNASDIIKADESENELVGISLLKDGTAYYNRTATVLSGGPETSQYRNSFLTAAEIEWTVFWNEVADHVGKTEKTVLKIFEDKESDFSSSHPYFEQVFWGEDFFDVMYFLGEPENLTRMGNIGFIAEYSLDSTTRLDLFFAYEHVVFNNTIPGGSDIYGAALSMAFLCSDEFGEPSYERVFFNSSDMGLDLTTSEPWGAESSLKDRTIHYLYTSIYEVYNDFGIPHKTLSYPNNIIYVYENEWGDTLYYVAQKGDSGVIAFSDNIEYLDSADEISTGKNCNLTIDELRELFGEINSFNSEISSNHSLAYIYRNLGLPAVSYRKPSNGTNILKYSYDGEVLTITCK